MKKSAALFQLGTDLGEAQTRNANALDSRQAQEEVCFVPVSTGSIGNNVVAGPWTHSDENKDHFIHRDGKVYAGTHMIIDLWGAERLDDMKLMESAMRECVATCGATLLHIHLHHFTPNGGISGVAVLAESHISVHTWPERNYAAFDVFMCGDSKPELAVGILQKAFSAQGVNAERILRGDTDQEPTQ